MQRYIQKIANLVLTWQVFLYKSSKLILIYFSISDVQSINCLGYDSCQAFSVDSNYLTTQLPNTQIRCQDSDTNNNIIILNSLLKINKIPAIKQLIQINIINIINMIKMDYKLALVVIMFQIQLVCIQYKVSVLLAIPFIQSNASKEQ